MRENGCHPAPGRAHRRIQSAFATGTTFRGARGIGSEGSVPSSTTRCATYVPTVSTVKVGSTEAGSSSTASMPAWAEIRAHR